MYIEVLKEFGVTQTPELTLKILTYEVGKLNQIDVYKERFGRAGYIGDERNEMQDVITMISLLMEQRGYNVEEEIQLGLSKLRDRIKEVSKVKT